MTEHTMKDFNHFEADLNEAIAYGNTQLAMTLISENRELIDTFAEMGHLTNDQILDAFEAELYDDYVGSYGLC